MRQRLERAWMERKPGTSHPHLSPSSGNARAAGASASELMFFHAAPFAHVIAYEDRLREKRKNGELRLARRRQQASRWRGSEDGAPLLSLRTRALT